jgi:hypothetical protein
MVTTQFGPLFFPKTREKRGELYCLLCDEPIATAPPSIIGLIRREDQVNSGHRHPLLALSGTRSTAAMMRSWKRIGEACGMEQAPTVSVN